MNYREALQLVRQAEDAERKYQAALRTRKNLEQAEGLFDAQMLEMQTPDIAGDTSARLMANDKSIYQARIKTLLQSMANRPKGTTGVMFSAYDGKPELSAWNPATSVWNREKVAYDNGALAASLAKLVADTRTGAVMFDKLDTDNPVVDFYARESDDMEDNGFTMLDIPERTNYQAPEGWTPVAYDKDNLYLRDANGAFSLQPLTKPQVKTAAGSYQQYYNEYMNDPVRKRLRERGGITVPLGLALHGAYVGSRLGPMLQYAVQGGTDEGTIAGALGGSGLGLLAGLMLHRNYSDRQLLKDREDADRYAKGKLSQNQ